MSHISSALWGVRSLKVQSWWTQSSPSQATLASSLICLRGTGSQQQAGKQQAKTLAHRDYLDFSGQLICFRRHFTICAKSWDPCSVFRLLLSMSIVDANCETLDKTLRSFRPCPAFRREEKSLSEGEGSAVKRANMRVMRDVNCKCKNWINCSI